MSTIGGKCPEFESIELHLVACRFFCKVFNKWSPCRRKRHNENLKLIKPYVFFWMGPTKNLRLLKFSFSAFKWPKMGLEIENGIFCTCSFSSNSMVTYNAYKMSWIERPRVRAPDSKRICFSFESTTLNRMFCCSIGQIRVNTNFSDINPDLILLVHFVWQKFWLKSFSSIHLLTHNFIFFEMPNFILFIIDFLQ